MFHIAPIAAVAASASYIATAGYDNRVILWDAFTHKAIAMGMHDHLLNHCSFSSNGKLLVSASSDYSARIWEVPSLRLRTCLYGHTDDIDMAVFSPDDQRIATCALDRTIRIFDLSGQCHNVLRGHTGNIISLAWRPDGKTLVSSGVDGTVREWDANSGECIACHNIEGVRTDSFAIATDGTIYAGDDEGRIVIISASVNDSDIAFHAAHQAGIKKIVYDPTHQRLISISYDRTLAIWAIQADRSVRLVRRSNCPSIIWARSAAFITASRIALGTFGSQYAIYDALTDRWHIDGIIPDPSLNTVVMSKGVQYTIGDAGVFLRNGLPVASMGSLCNFLVETDGLMLTGGQMGQVFNAMTGTVLYEHHSPLNCGVAFKRNGKSQVAIGSYTGEILIFTPEKSGKLSLETTLRPYHNAVKSLSVSHNRLFSVCASTDVAWHNLDNLELVRYVHHAHERIANAGCRAGLTGFASVGRDRKLRLWLDSGDEVYDTPHPNSVKCISVSDDLNIIMTGAYTGTVAAFDLRTRSWISFERPTIAGISGLSYDSQTGLFWASSYDGKLYSLQVRAEYPETDFLLSIEENQLQERCA